MLLSSVTVSLFLLLCVVFLPVMAYQVVSSVWIIPLYETRATIAHVADSLWVTMTTGVMAEVGTGDRCRAEGAAAVPVKFETKPKKNVVKKCRQNYELITCYFGKYLFLHALANDKVALQSQQTFHLRFS